MFTFKRILPLTCVFLCLAAGLPAFAQEMDANRPFAKTWGDRVEVTYAQLEAGFANPSMAYAPFMFWFWDTPLTPEAKAMAAEMADKVSRQRINPGYPFAIPVPWCPPMPQEQWLSKDWFDALDGASKNAQKNGAYMGFCDDYSFPTGRAGGRLLEQHPELKAQSLKWDILEADGGKTVQLPESFFTVAARITKPSSNSREKWRLAVAPRIGSWIWHPNAKKDNTVVCFRSAMNCDPARKVVAAELDLAVDDGYVLYLNGQKLGEDTSWQSIKRYSILEHLKPGQNVIAVEAKNVTGPCGLTGCVNLIYADGSLESRLTGKDWICSDQVVTGWTAPEFDDTGWTPAEVLAEAGGSPWNMVLPKSFPRAEIQSATLQIIGGGKPFAWQIPEGVWRIYSFQQFHTGHWGSPINNLDERTPDAFMEIAYKPYVQYFGDRLSQSLIGAFRDSEGAYGYKLAWSDSLERLYRKNTREDIRKRMPLMIDEDTEGLWAKARWDWYDCVSTLYSDRFWRKCSEWLSRQGLYCTAHLWEDDLMLQAAMVGDNFRFQRALSMAGVDSLVDTCFDPRFFKEAQSVSEFDSKRFASETLGVIGWNASPTLMKRAVNATTAWGVSQFMGHINILSRALVQMQWPPDWYTENPYFPYLHQWADYTRRANYVTSHGKTVPDTLLLNPMDSVWILTADGSLDPACTGSLPDIPGWFGEKVHQISESYIGAIRQLTNSRVEFLATDNHYLRKMQLLDGKLAVGEFAFRSIVMPPMLVMPLDVAAKVVAFSQAGGHVYSLGELPTCSTENGANDPKLIQAMRTLRSQPTFVQCYAGLAPELAKPGSGLRSSITFETGEFPMIQQHRRIDGRDFFWLVNNSDVERNCRIAIRGATGLASIWDCETGRISELPSELTIEGSVLELAFQANEAFFLVLDPKKPAKKAEPQPKTNEMTMPISGPWVWRIVTDDQPPVPNPILLPADITSASGVVRELEQWNKFGLEKFSGYVDYATHFSFPAARGRVLLDLGRVDHLAEVWVNGKNVGVRLWAPYRFDITEAVSSGTNTLRIRVGNLIANNMGIPADSGLMGPVVVKSGQK